MTTIKLHAGDLPATVQFTGAVAVDTETLGLRPLRDRLCLVQLSQGDGSAHLVQIPAGAGPGSAPRLAALMADQSVLKIFHYARFDIAVLKHFLGATVRPVYCTKIASKLARTYTDRHGLKDLVGEIVGVELSKQQQSSDWGSETLTQQQLAYAASDVLYLHQLKAKLDHMLAREGRTACADAAFAFLPTRADLDLMGFEDMDLFAH